MSTKRTLHPDQETQIDGAVALLRRGGVVAYPTDTLYGLGASVFDEAAVERVFEIKRRPQGMPLPLLLTGSEMLPMVVDKVSRTALSLAEMFWPGPLTLVLPKNPLVPSLVAARGWTVAVRVPDHPVPRELARLLGNPITGTSANRSGGPEPSTAEEVRRQLGDQVDMIVQAGPSPAGRASTILDITGKTARVLRIGGVSIDAIERVCGPVSVDLASQPS